MVTETPSRKRYRQHIFIQSRFVNVMKKNEHNELSNDKFNWPLYKNIFDVIWKVIIKRRYLNSQPNCGTIDPLFLLLFYYSVTNLDYWIEMIIFVLILTPFSLGIVSRGSGVNLLV